MQFQEVNDRNLAVFGSIVAMSSARTAASVCLCQGRGEGDNICPGGRGTDFGAMLQDPSREAPWERRKAFLTGAVIVD